MALRRTKIEKESMKVLQTIGIDHSRQQAGIFQYKRTPEGVFIDAAVGRAPSLNPPQILITNQEWLQILETIHTGPATYRLSTPARAVPDQLPNLPDLIMQALAANPPPWAGNTSWLSYICAILEHEGSVDIFGGPAGAGGLFVALRKDTAVPAQVLEQQFADIR